MDNYWSNIQLPEEQDNINAYLLRQKKRGTEKALTYSFWSAM